jgi:hypothetical protein
MCLIDIDICFVPVEKKIRERTCMNHDRLNSIPLANSDDLFEIADLSFHAVDALYYNYDFTPRAVRARLSFNNGITQDIFQAAT